MGFGARVGYRDKKRSFMDCHLDAILDIAVVLRVRDVHENHARALASIIQRGRSLDAAVNVRRVTEYAEQNIPMRPVLGMKPGSRPHRRYSRIQDGNFLA